MSKLFWFPSGIATMYIYQSMTHDQLVIVAGVGLGLIISAIIAAIMAVSHQAERETARHLADNNVALAARVTDLEAQLGDAMERLSIVNRGRMGTRRSSMRRKAA